MGTRRTEVGTGDTEEGSEEQNGRKGGKEGKRILFSL